MKTKRWNDGYFFIYLFLASWSISSKVTQNFCLTWLRIRGSYNCLLGFDHLLEQFTGLRKVLTATFTSLWCYKGHHKGWRCTARWRDTSGEVWKGPVCRGFGPEGQMHLPPSARMCSPTQKLFEPHTFDIFLEGRSRRHEGTFMQFPAPVSLEDRVWSWTFQASDQVLGFLVSSLQPGAQVSCAQRKDQVAQEAGFLGALVWAVGSYTKPSQNWWKFFRTGQHTYWLILKHAQKNLLPGHYD